MAENHNKEGEIMKGSKKEKKGERVKKGGWMERREREKMDWERENKKKWMIYKFIIIDDKMIKKKKYKKIKVKLIIIPMHA